MHTDEDFELIKKLSELKPQQPSLELESRIAAGIDAARRGHRLDRLRQSALWFGFASAAVLILTVGVVLFSGRLQSPFSADKLAGGTSPGLAGADSDLPPSLRAENRLQARIDDGIVFLENGIGARQYRYQFLDRVVWKNPQSGAILEVEIPREEVVLVPVHTF